MLKRNSGFTLVELLVVIAIISILASLLLPVLARAREAAYSTQCQGQNKQLLLASFMYHDDYGRFQVADNVYRWFQWDRLGSYFGKNLQRITKLPDGINWEVPPQKSLLDCPTNNTSWYGKNSWIGCGSQGNTTLQQIVKPSVFVMFQDSNTYGFIYVSNYPYVGGWIGTGDSNLCDFRHSGGVNYGFADSHVKSIRNPNAAFLNGDIRAKKECASR